ncbi:MAG: two component transcriptional regulator, LytTR family [Bacteroidetes bacterium]|nr:two component transcriptional regulator, LytTR family [Bacteroidota bacterium]
MITAIIVDDEKSGRETLSFILEKHFAKKVQVLATGASVNEAVQLIGRHNPQLVFLDIEMPNEPGLNLVNKVANINFEIIVTTAHREYGIDAIKAGVSDYLLKPVDIDELETSLNKIEAKISAKAETAVLKHMMNIVAAASPNKKIPLLVGNNKTIFVEPSAIVRCEASGNYTEVWFTNGKMELITRLIKDVEELLAGVDFLRVHKSHLINIEHVKAHLKSEDNITMADGSVIPLSRNMKADFLKKMNAG